MRRLRTTAAVTMTMLALAACTTSPDTSPDTSPTSSTTSSATASPTTKSPTPTQSSASPSATSPSPSTSASPSPSSTLAPGTTYLTFHLVGVANCAGGRVGVHNTTITPVWEKFTSLPVSGSVTVPVPTKYTKHMAFDVQCRGWPSTGAVPIIALQYAGVPVGQAPPTTSKGRPLKTFASYCWAGTTDPQVVLSVQGWTDKGDGAPLSGKVALWVDPGVATVPIVSSGQRWVEAPDGQLGHQDEPYC
jgi:hypothetical protein